MRHEECLFTFKVDCKPFRIMITSGVLVLCQFVKIFQVIIVVSRKWVVADVDEIKTYFDVRIDGNKNSVP